VRFAPLPLEERGIIYEQFKGLVDYLAEETGLLFRWVHHGDYADILGEFRAGAIDLAYLGPLPYVILRRDTPHAEPLACFRDSDGAASYTCSLVAWGADRRLPEGLSGVHVGLTQPYSTCGYLAVSQMLASAGRSLGADGNSFEYAGSHQAAALGVARGRYDVAGVKTAIARRYTHLGLETIATSSRFPGFTLVANTRTLSPDRIRRLRAALLDLDPSADAGLRARMGHWGRHIRNGAVPAARCDYAGVEAALAGLPWPIPGTEQ
jgi:phosphonate transport system substrate-binding protein